MGLCLVHFTRGFLCFASFLRRALLKNFYFVSELNAGESPRYAAQSWSFLPSSLPPSLDEDPRNRIKGVCMQKLCEPPKMLT